MGEKSWLWRAVFGNWQDRLTKLFAGVLLLQYVSWIVEEDYVWLPETARLVTATLLFVFVVELFYGINRWIRLPIQLAGVIVATGLTSGYSPVSGSMRTLPKAGQLLVDNAGQLHPFIWFSLGAWLVYLLTMWCVKEKKRIYFVMLFSVLAMGIRDSFSLIILWDELALVICSGLCLLVIRHIVQLKSKSPTGWSHIADYPATFAVTIVLLLVLTMGFGALAPETGSVLTDPYTLYKNWQGEAVPVSGKGKVSSSTPLSAPGNATSGYSRNDESLGGGFDFDYTVVMTVESTNRSYWRGESRSLYNGSGWESSEEERQPGMTGIAAGNTLASDPLMQNVKSKTIEVRQTVTIEKDEQFPVLFGAFAVSKVESINGGTGGFERLQWSPTQASLKWPEATRTSRIPYPNTYTLVSEVPYIDEAGLRTAQLEQSDRRAVEQYLQLPPSLPPRVRQLAQEITQGAANPYDKAKKIEQYLQMNYKYNNKPPDTGKSKDFVDRFLFEVKEGYCDYYSTAMAVLGRSVGLPTRWVKGYAPGDTVLQDLALDGALPQGVIDPNGAAVYTVRNSNAHSWVEVYFAGWGWIPFEPTSGFAMPVLQPAEEPAAVPETEPVIETPVAPVEENSDWGKPASVAVTAGSVVIAAAVVLLAWLYRRPILRLLERIGWIEKLGLGRKREPATLNQQVIVAFGKLLRRSKRKGYGAYEHETARETMRRWSRKDAWLAKDLEALLAIFEKAKYSNNPITPEEWSKASAITNKLRKEL
ncbi:DUF4129 domain-containing transglutaminase family protein [Paenibacillus contaminans]|uniref:Cysteine protease n=1 Tax=Paenibacillus contaminans TaxID=450362 RepID=A0A329MPM5_9BACL|nr:transglutaminase domain-containing protein [Paenibacillus contaminans]RAV21835.1 cysteine protease [Paenibacillus contaminans]